MTGIKQSKILIIATNGFEQAELEIPRNKLTEAGARVAIASPEGATSWVGTRQTGAARPRWT
jgi:protease I